MAKKNKPMYTVRTYVMITKGPFIGEKGTIIAVRGLFTKTYDVALDAFPGKVLRKRPAEQLQRVK